VGELACSIAHELNEPLAAMSLGLESLRAPTPKRDPKRGEREAIQAEGGKMRRFMSSLHDMSQRNHPIVTTLSIRTVIEQALELARHHLVKRGIRVVQEFAPDLPLTRGDRQELEQVFLILLTNASDAMRDGGSLTLRAFVEGRSANPGESGRGETESGRIGEDRLVIELADNGIGASPENLPRVAEPLLSTKPLGTWTGLGLSNCRRIIEAHDGQVVITSEAGRGTTVRISLPVASGLDQVNRRTA
jgi:two-component system NtrC family sensor kinase